MVLSTLVALRERLRMHKPRGMLGASRARCGEAILRFASMARLSFEVVRDYGTVDPCGCEGTRRHLDRCPWGNVEKKEGGKEV